MIRKIDTNSEEFQTELELTKQFTDNVLKEHSLVYNPDNEVNESIQMGLTRNKMIYGKRFCPCFMVIGQTPAEQESNSENRMCPCVPALTNEIPSKGSCHCGIFNTEEKACELSKENHLHDAVAAHSGLSKEECEELLNKQEVNAAELESLLEARDAGVIKFNLIDTREWMEWVGQRIKGTDFLIPTTSFYQALERVNDQKDTPVVVYCLSGSRSAYCQRIMIDLGFKSVANLDYGISSYSGLCESGDI